MTVAASTASCVRKTRSALPDHGRNVLEPFILGFAVALGVATIAAAVVGLGWTVSTTLDISLAPPADRLAWVAPPADVETRPSQVAARFPSPIAERFPAPAMALASATRAPNRFAALAYTIPASGTLNDPRADVIYTGSLGTPTPKPAPPPRTATVAMFETPSASDDTRPRPAPRARTQLASLTPPGGDLGIAPEPDTSSSRTAIYDIIAQAVYLPNGEKLEAHSGLGSFMDNPRHVHLRMRGATPPNTYKLTLREALFHGVRAIRMTPENDDGMHGRDGILAHTYMLGPNGQSNGCVSFKDYPKFLRAFLRGEVDRMVVVARLDKPPAFYAGNGGKGANAL